MHMIISFAKSGPFCLGLYVLTLVVLNSFGEIKNNIFAYFLSYLTTEVLHTVEDKDSLSCVVNTMQYDDFITGAIASQITSLSIVYLNVYSDADQRKHQSSASLAFVRGIHRGTGEFPAQMTSYAENISIWRHHHGLTMAMLHKEPRHQ